MFGILRHKGLTLLSIASSILIGCSSNESSTSKEVAWRQIQGETQGTTYGITLEDPEESVEKEAIDSILHDFDMALSSYIDASIVSKINTTSDSVNFQDTYGYFETCYEKSRTVFETTNGAFDPSVFPLVKAWGFFGKELEKPSEAALDSILNFVGFGKPLHHYSMEGGTGSFRKENPSFRMDFNAIAQGLSVDILAAYLDANKIQNYYIEIGGEIVVKGKNKEELDWRIGVDSPNQKEGTRVIDNVVNISNKAIATSGNYRKFYVKDGVKYAHTIHPTSGKPVQHSLLSATVITNSCAEADAYATAFMVMGVERSMEFVRSHPKLDLDVYLLYDNGSGKIERTMTKGFKEYLK